eukprot:Rmarinus@m.22621
MSAEECADHGFSDSLMCPTCDKLYESVQDPILAEECRQCCAVESDTNVVKYESAKIEVCSRSLRWHTELKNFIEDHETDFENLKVKYRPGAQPELTMYSDKGKRKIKISSWKSDEIYEYLSQRLQ